MFGYPRFFKCISFPFLYWISHLHNLLIVIVFFKRYVERQRAIEDSKNSHQVALQDKVRSGFFTYFCFFVHRMHLHKLLCDCCTNTPMNDDSNESGTARLVSIATTKWRMISFFLLVFHVKVRSRLSGQGKTKRLHHSHCPRRRIKMREKQPKSEMPQKKAVLTSRE